MIDRIEQNPDSLVRLKVAMRAAARAARSALSPSERRAAAETVAKLDLTMFGDVAGAEVAAYMALGDEFDPGALLARLIGLGALPSMPRITAHRCEIAFHRCWPGDEMAKGVWGIREPLPDAPEVRPVLLLVPLLAFDARGWRLGYGGGYYDRAIARLRATDAVRVVGVGFASQEVDAVPHLDYDQRLDWALTEAGAQQFSG